MTTKAKCDLTTNPTAISQSLNRDLAYFPLLLNRKSLSGRVRQTLGELKEKEGRTAQKSREYVLRDIDDGMDWRKKIEGTPFADAIPVDARGLGCMGSNEDKLFANRMKHELDYQRSTAHG